MPLGQAEAELVVARVAPAALVHLADRVARPSLLTGQTALAETYMALPAAAAVTMVTATPNQRVLIT
jgi:hypothetical protein